MGYSYKNYDPPRRSSITAYQTSKRADFLSWPYSNILRFVCKYQRSLILATDLSMIQTFTSLVLCEVNPQIPNISSKYSNEGLTLMSKTRSNAILTARFPMNGPLCMISWDIKNGFATGHVLSSKMEQTWIAVSLKRSGLDLSMKRCIWRLSSTCCFRVTGPCRPPG